MSVDTSVEVLIHYPIRDIKAFHVSSAIFKDSNLHGLKEEAATLAKPTTTELNRSGNWIGATPSEGDPLVQNPQSIVVSGIQPGVDKNFTLDAMRHS